HAGGAHGGADGEGAEDLVELAVLLRGLEHVLHQGLPASQLGVGIDVGPQVLQNVLGAVLADGQAAGGQNVRHVAGANLRVQPGQAGVVVLVGVVLGVVNDLDAVVLVGAVELQDGVADVVVQVHAAVGQYRLV